MENVLIAAAVLVLFVPPAPTRESTAMPKHAEASIQAITVQPVL